MIGKIAVSIWMLAIASVAHTGMLWPASGGMAFMTTAPTITQPAPAPTVEAPAISATVVAVEQTKDWIRPFQFRANDEALADLKLRHHGGG